MIIQNGFLYDSGGNWKQKNLLLREGRIAAVWDAGSPMPAPCGGPVGGGDGAPSQEETVLDAADCYVTPGLIDLHFHGCAGYDFCDGTPEALDAMAAYELSQGVTTVNPASMTLPEDQLKKIFSNAAEFFRRQESDGADRDGRLSRLVGINMEGPYISEKKKGAQNAAYLLPPDIAHFSRLQEAAGGLIKLTTLAPELPGAMEFIEAERDRVRISLGHTNADCKTAKQAFCAGAAHVTHLFNAMPLFTHREPGVIGAAFDHPGVTAELICDGVHIDPTAIRAAFALFGADRIILISDSMMATGLDDGEYALGGQPVCVRGSLATLSDGTLAGSVTNLFSCVKKAVEFGIPAANAFRCASENPAKCLGIYGSVGSLETGKAADVLIVSRDLQLKHIVHRGVIAK